MGPFTTGVFFLFYCIFCCNSYTDAVTVEVSGYDPMNSLINITCSLNGNAYSKSKEVQWSMDGEYLTGCNPMDCMTPKDERYKFTPNAKSITMTIQPIDFIKDEAKWACTLDGLSDLVNIQFFPMPYNGASSGKPTSDGNPMGGGMSSSILPLIGVIIAFITLILVIAVLVIAVWRRRECNKDPENTVSKKEGNGMDVYMKPLLSKDKGKVMNDTSAKADAELIENSVRDHKDKIKGISEEMKKTEKVATDTFETAKEVEGVALILLRLAKGEKVGDDDKGYLRNIDPKEALKEELHEEIQKRGDRLKSIGAEYENDPQEITLANKHGNFTEIQTLINEAKRHMCTTKQIEGDLRDYSKGTQKVLKNVMGTMDEIRPKLKKK